MTSRDDRPGDAAGLSRRAEEVARGRAAWTPENTESLSPEEIRRTLHELQAHQIELETQIEDLRRTQADLEAARARYFDLYDLGPVGYCTLSEQGLILEANSTVATLLGVAKSDLVNRRLTSFIFPEDEDIYYLHRKQLFETGESQTCDLRMLKRDAALFWAHIEAAAAEDVGGAPVCRIAVSDVTTERRLADSVLLEAESRYRLLFEHSPDGIVIIDPPTARFLEFNETACRQLGYSRHEFARLSISDIEAVETSEETQAQIAKTISERRNEFETRHRTRQGETRNIHVVAQVSELSGRLVYHCVWRDVTAAKQAEREKLEHLRELERWRKVTLGREERMRELKCEVNRLLTRLDEPARYAETV